MGWSEFEVECCWRGFGKGEVGRLGIGCCGEVEGKTAEEDLVNLRCLTMRRWYGG